MSRGVIFTRQLLLIPILDALASLEPIGWIYTEQFKTPKTTCGELPQECPALGIVLNWFDFGSELTLFH